MVARRLPFRSALRSQLAIYRWRRRARAGLLSSAVAADEATAAGNAAAKQPRLRLMHGEVPVAGVAQSVRPCSRSGRRRRSQAGRPQGEGAASSGAREAEAAARRPGPVAALAEVASEQAKMSGALSLLKENDAARSASVEADRARRRVRRVEAARGGGCGPAGGSASARRRWRAQQWWVKAEAAAACARRTRRRASPPQPPTRAGRPRSSRGMSRRRWTEIARAGSPAVQALNERVKAAASALAAEARRPGRRRSRPTRRAAALKEVEARRARGRSRWARRRRRPHSPEGGGRGGAVL